MASEPDPDVEPPGFDPDGEVGVPARPSYPLWLVVARWGFALFVIFGALLLPVFLLGIRLHVHPWAVWRGTAAPGVAGVAGLRVRLESGLQVPDRAQLEVGGGGFLYTPRACSVEVEASASPAGTRVDLTFEGPGVADSSLRLVFAQTGETIAEASAFVLGPRGTESEPLSGTLLLSTLDWRTPGPKSCVFALHADESDRLCYRGSFPLER